MSERVIGGAFQVLNTLGAGFLEKLYENALRKAGLIVAWQHGITVMCDDVVVREYAVDLLVEGTNIVALKAIKALDGAHTAQCLNYVNATGLRLCLLLSIGKSHLEIQRVAHGL